MEKFIKNYADRLSHDNQKSNQFLNYLHNLAGKFIKFEIYTKTKVKLDIWEFLDESPNEEEDKEILADFLMESYVFKKKDKLNSKAEQKCKCQVLHFCRNLNSSKTSNINRSLSSSSDETDSIDDNNKDILIESELNSKQDADKKHSCPTNANEGTSESDLTKTNVIDKIVKNSSKKIAKRKITKELFGSNSSGDENDDENIKVESEAAAINKNNINAENVENNSSGKGAKRNLIKENFGTSCSSSSNENEDINDESKQAAVANNYNIIAENKENIGTKQTLKDTNNRKRKSSVSLDRNHQNSKRGRLNLLKNSIMIKCDECGLKFARKFTLKRHMETIHKQSSTYTCDLCGFRTNRWDNLVSHQRIHKN